MADFEWLNPSTWSFDGFSAEVSDFAVNTFDTFVYDTGYGSDPFFSLGGDASGSIWQDGWDMIDNIWGNDPIYPTPDGKAISQADGLFSADQIALYGRGPKSGGILNSAIAAGKDSFSKYAKSGKMARDAVKYGAAGLQGYYKNKKAQERFDEVMRQREKESRRQYPVRRGFLTPTRGK